MNQRKLFLGCFVALIATAFGFIIRAMILNDWGTQYGFNQTQKGALTGIGLAPFAISIVLFSLFIDRIGYGKTMVFAFVCHVISAVLTIFADSFQQFYFATFLFGLANGAVEAVINPVTATIYDKQKTHMLNILHAGWPGGMVLGGILTILMSTSLFAGLPGDLWRWKVGLVLLPVIAYGIMLFGQKFPVNERVAAGVSYRDMLREFGSIGCFLVMFMLMYGIADAISVATKDAVTGESIILPQMLIWGIIIASSVAFHIAVGSLGKPLFIILLLIMVPLAVTELGVDSWITSLMEDILKGASGDAGSISTWLLIYTSAIMFVLRFFAGPIVHRISPLGLLCVCAAIAAAGLFWFSVAVGTAMVVAAATCYGVGKTFFWPTTLGVVSEQFPRGGALTLNAIGGVGMLAAGIIGAPLIGYIQDSKINRALETQAPEIHAQFSKQNEWALGKFTALDGDKFTQLKKEDPENLAVEKIETISRQEKQAALATIAILPCIMFVSYLGLLLYFKSKGGYKAEQISSPSHGNEEKFTGGVEGPVE